jgi:hypothetical protein
LKSWCVRNWIVPPTFPLSTDVRYRGLARCTSRRVQRGAASVCRQTLYTTDTSIDHWYSPKWTCICCGTCVHKEVCVFLFWWYDSDTLSIPVASLETNDDHIPKCLPHGHEWRVSPCIIGSFLQPFDRMSKEHAPCETDRSLCNGYIRSTPS